ncbi:hypothetical protein FSP39_011684 [Pinctada imbricata]|uniref:Uncharacterized protein n=1 Tax=Pinctada imbricata TaxID=66713 RepID=A0AA88XLX6_PINIB|nr:hypothetical protein FSP39_011684 [Pinctada imbricata]
MAENKFEHLPLSICQISSLQFLNLRGNRLVSLSQDFDSLQNLRELNLAFNKIHIIPPAISKLKSLIYLNLAGNKIRLVPDFFKSLNHLTVFHLQFNEVEKIPNAFPNIQHLNIADNCLDSLAVSCMRKLRYLNANNNKLEYLPNGIFCASKLETLKLRGNRIGYIPHDIVSFKKMKVLDLGHNQLTTFPKVIDQMAKLDFFNIRGNAIKYTEDKAGNLWTQRFTVVNDSRSRSRSSRRKESTMIAGHEITYSVPTVSMATDREQFVTGYRKGSNEELDELLQNGFSLRRIHSNYGSVMHLHNNGDLKKDKQSKQGSIGQTIGRTDRRSADFGLLGICNQVEMMLNKDLLQPVLSLQRNSNGKNFLDKRITEVEEGVWKMIDNRGNKPSNIVSSKAENFTVTPSGRNFTSSVEQGISIFFPTKSVTEDVDVKLKDPIVHLYSERDVEFKHLVTMTVQPPPSGGKGHLNIVSIRKDNSCVPVSLGHRQKNGSITVNMWTLEG